MTTFEVITADVLEGLARLPAGSVQTCVTSPPYWGLRDYGTATWIDGDPDHDHVGTVPRTVAGGSGKQDSNAGSISVRSGDCACGAVRRDSQLGLEPTVDEYVAKMVEVFAEVRRVLRTDGTVWLNLGDSYTTSGGNGRAGNTDGAVGRADRPDERRSRELKPKDLVGVPWRVAFALQNDGWWLRSDIIWAKPNPMPESITDRPTKSHEYVFLLTKSSRYYFDHVAVREPHVAAMTGGNGFSFRNDDKPAHGHGREYNADGRNIRTVWNIATEPYAGAHFATFPKRLITPCIKAGSSEGGCCAICGAPRRRLTEHTNAVVQTLAPTAKMHRVGDSVNDRRTYTAGLIGTATDRTIGWEPTCQHDSESVPCTVLDPFTGSGTTGLVALRHQRDFVGVELNPSYAQMARDRIRNDGPLFNTEKGTEHP